MLILIDDDNIINIDEISNIKTEISKDKPITIIKMKNHSEIKTGLSVKEIFYKLTNPKDTVDQFWDKLKKSIEEAAIKE